MLKEIELLANNSKNIKYKNEKKKGSVFAPLRQKNKKNADL
jgi:hypothetical protein